jgi:hypothetical protein
LALETVKGLGSGRQMWLFCQRVQISQLTCVITGCRVCTCKDSCIGSRA